MAKGLYHATPLHSAAEQKISPWGLPDAQDMRCASYQQDKGFTYGANGHSICRMPTLAASVSHSSRSTSRA